MLHKKRNIEILIIDKNTKEKTLTHGLVYISLKNINRLDRKKRGRCTCGISGL